MAVAACYLCPVQWDCAVYAEATGDVWNVCGADPMLRFAFRRAVRETAGAIELMRLEGIPVADGMAMALGHALEPSHIVVRSEHGVDVES